MNPIQHLKPIGKQLIPVENGFEWLGSNMRLKHETNLYADKNQKVSLGKVYKNQIVKVESLDAKLCKVQLPSGEFGYIKRTDLDRATGAIERIALKSDIPLFLKPNELTSIDMIAANERVEVLDKNEDFLWIKTSKGKLGWINPKLAKNEL